MNILKLFFTVILIFIVAACSGGGSNSSTKNDSNGDTDKSIEGTLLAADESTPVASATVYIPAGDKPGSDSLVIECKKPPEAYLVYTCSFPDGSFTLDISNIEGGIVNVKAVKGEFQGVFSVDPNNPGSIELGDLVMPSDVTSGAPKMAVITGAYDRMEDILAKMGYGELDESFRLQLGSETFDIYSGFNDDLPDSYLDGDVLFQDGDDDDDLPDIHQYDIVFINCGIDTLGDNSDGFDEFPIPNDPGVTDILQNYVKAGGKLYVSDLSYDFVEQTFPEFIDFYGNAGLDPATPETVDEAQRGEADILSKAQAQDQVLNDWLSNVSCGGESRNCINDDGTIDIQGFLVDWAVMEGPHPEKSSAVNIWISGPVEWLNGVGQVESGSRPLTVTFNYGEGTVLYSSYHSLEETPSADFHPQERILQFLIFEL